MSMSVNDIPDGTSDEFHPQADDIAAGPIDESNQVDAEILHARSHLNQKMLVQDEQISGNASNASKAAVKAKQTKKRQANDLVWL